MNRVVSHGWSEHELEQRLGRLLQIGVLVSALVVGIGAAVYLGRHGGEQVDYTIFRGEPRRLRTLSGIVAEAVRGGGRGAIQLGLLLLIATPVGRVVVAGYGFFRQRDWTYVGITIVVLLTLVASLFGAGSLTR